MRDAVGLQQAVAVIGEQGNLLRARHGERVDLVARHPVDVVVDRLVGQLDRLGVDRPGDLREVDRLLGDPDRLVGGQRDPGGEAPGAVVDHPDGETEVLVVGRALQHAVAQRDRLGADPLQPELGVRRAEILGALQGRVGELVSGKGKEGCIDIRHGSDPRPCPVLRARGGGPAGRPGG